MSQKLIQSQEQKTVQVQRLTQQQMLAVKMLEMPLTDDERRILLAGCLINYYKEN